VSQMPRKSESNRIKRLRMARVHKGRTVLSEYDAETIRSLLAVNEERLAQMIRAAIKEGAARLADQPDSAPVEDR
jgi:hypothetical protein